MKRIPAPKFRVGRFVLNEYEVRQLQLDVVQGNINHNKIVVIDIASGTKSKINRDGSFTHHLPGLSIATDLLLDWVKLRHKNNHI